MFHHIICRQISRQILDCQILKLPDYSGFFKYEVRSTWGHSLKQGA